ncbi:Codeine O-demethylase [Heracleum sosnowskyi]|uniref:Codeine O-demethylase n=1 Tax=Heracleum sosnowskyi TaxID=360622 RepID=A0AAD8M3Q5_9APIA|nr:Codeine O-demethylase [Heracleum sosnowskyi]
MAGVLPAGEAEVLLLKRVQEMVLDGEEPPALYICRNGEDSDDHVNSSMVSPIPIIDLSLVLPSATSTDTSIRELEKLRSALSTWGCFQAIGHGISSSFLDEIRKIAKEFFKQPVAEKKKIAKTVAEFEGYGADPAPEEGQPLDWSDRIVLEVYPQDNKNFNLWPAKPESFRDTLEEYTMKIKMLAEVTSKVFAKSLNLDQNCFLDELGDQATITARFNYYSCCQRPDLVLGLKPHSDVTAFTMILQDESGLQIRKDDRWFTVPKNPDSLVFILGDYMEIMTNGIFKSPVHRVLSNLQMERISIAMLYNPPADKEIGPLDDLVTEENPRLFKNVKDYITTYAQYYQRGQRAIHTAQV